MHAIKVSENRDQEFEGRWGEIYGRVLGEKREEKIMSLHYDLNNKRNNLNKLKEVLGINS